MFTKPPRKDRQGPYRVYGVIGLIELVGLFGFMGFIGFRANGVYFVDRFNGVSRV